MRLPRARLVMRGITAALLAAWFTTEGGPTPPLGPKLTRAADQDKTPAPAAGEDLPARWRRLRAEYVKIAESLVGPLDRAERPGALGPAVLLVKSRKAEVEDQTARLAREVAERALTVYNDQTAKQELDDAKGEVAAAEAALKRAENWVERLKVVRQQVDARRDGKGDDLSAAEILAGFHLDRAEESEKLALDRCKVEVERARVRQDLLTRFSQRKRQLMLRAEIEQKRAEELSRQAEWELAKAEEARANHQSTNPGMWPEERKALALLAEAVRSPGTGPPWERDPTEFRAFLDRFEARIGEARTLVEQAREKAEMDRFLRVSARVLRKQATPIGDEPKAGGR